MVGWRLNARIERQLGGVHLLLHLERGEQAALIGARVLALGVAVPMVARHRDEIPDPQLQVLVRARLVRDDDATIVRILAAIVVDVVQRLEAIRRVRIQRLHDLVGNAADLGRERAHEVIGHRQQMDVQNDAVQRRVRVARGHGRHARHLRVADDMILRILSARLLNHLRVVRGEEYAPHHAAAVHLQRAIVVLHVRHVLLDAVAGRLRAHLVRAPHMDPAIE